jgi:hypothetical protein
LFDYYLFVRLLPRSAESLGRRHHIVGTLFRNPSIPSPSIEFGDDLHNYFQ